MNKQQITSSRHVALAGAAAAATVVVASCALAYNMLISTKKKRQRVTTNADGTNCLKNKKRSSFSSILITGANIGLGKETARILAMEYSGVNRIILAGRSSDKIMKAKKDLEEQTGRYDIYETMIVDIGDNDHQSIRNTMNDKIKEPIDAFLMNAGGPIGKKFHEITTITEAGQQMMKIFQVNVLGHVVMLDELIKNNKLKKVAVFVASEAARGAEEISIPIPQIGTGTVNDFRSILNGTFYGISKKPPTCMIAYSHAKLIGTYWIGSLARRIPNIRFISVSPGATSGTNIGTHIPSTIRRILFFISIPLLEFIGKSHSILAGAQRYIDVLQNDDNNNNNKYISGHFYASMAGETAGPMVDQISVEPSLFYNMEWEDNCYKALHEYIC